MSKTSSNCTPAKKKKPSQKQRLYPMDLTRWAYEQDGNGSGSTTDARAPAVVNTQENVRRNSLKLVTRMTKDMTMMSRPPMITAATNNDTCVVLPEPDPYKRAAEMLALENEALRKELTQLHTAATTANAKRRNSTGSTLAMDKKDGNVAQLSKTIASLEARVKMLQHEVDEGKKKYDSLESRYKAVKNAAEKKNKLAAANVRQVPSSSVDGVMASPPPPPPPPPPTLAMTIGEAIAPAIEGLDNLDTIRIAQAVAKAVANEIAMTKNNTTTEEEMLSRPKRAPPVEPVSLPQPSSSPRPSKTSTSNNNKPFAERVKFQNGILVVESEGQDPIPLEKWCVGN